MITTETKIIYNCTCDKCGIKFEDESPDGTILWYEDSGSLESAMDNYDWQEIDNGYYCPECYELDDETDEYKVKQDEQNNKT